MIRLIILLLGAQALRGQRRLLMLFGWAWITVGALMLFDVLQDGRSVLALDALAVLLALEGLVAISAALVIGSSASRPVTEGIGLFVSGLFSMGRARRRQHRRHAGVWQRATA